MNASTLDKFTMADILQEILSKADSVEITPCKRFVNGQEQEGFVVHLNPRTVTLTERHGRLLQRVISELP